MPARQLVVQVVGVVIVHDHSIHLLMFVRLLLFVLSVVFGACCFLCVMLLLLCAAFPVVFGATSWATDR